MSACAAAVGGGDADRALGLAEAVEVVAVAVVEVAVEGLLLGEPLGGVGADRGADVAEDRRRLAAGLGGAGLDVARGRAAANSGVIQLKKAPSYAAPASAHIFGPIAASTRRTPGSASRSSGSASRIVVSGFFEKPAPTPSQSRSRSRPSRSIVGGDLLRRVAVERDHGDAELELPEPRRRRPASVSSPCAPGWSFDHIES